MKENFRNIEIGYSDHTIGLTACVSAISLGANIIEKHFTDTKKDQAQILYAQWMKLS